ncbi:MAG: hypothetical protein KF773_13505 [Deltaproteobacteria bacterium]|nr:hypothetical protein [Deltaproteobacteria bacterium]
MNRLVAAVVLCLVAAGLACGTKTSAIAELTKADGPVDKQAGTEPWASAPIGTEFFLGDAARTGDQGATLQVASGGATIAMQPKTILRFGGKSGSSKIAVEAGEIDLSGTGTYALEIGDVKLGNHGTVRVTARGTIELAIGDAQVSTSDGKTIDLQIGKVIDIGDVVVQSAPRDAGVPDAAVAVVDAAAPEAPVPAGDTVVEITGLRGEVLAPGEKVWKALTAGASPLTKGSKIRTGAGTTAKLVDGALTLELGAGARAAFDDRITLEAGPARATATGDGAVGLPGGAIALRGSDKGTADARLDAGAATTKVALVRATGKLTGVGDAELGMRAGDSATLARTGKITPLEAIPAAHDLRIGVGETSTVHDSRGATAIQFTFDGKCPDGGVVELDRDARFRTAKISAGKDAANHMVRGGTWAYRLRCMTKGGGEGAAVASGYVALVADGGTRALPKAVGVNPFIADGRAWKIQFPSVIPDLAVTFPVAGSSFRLHLAKGGKELTFDATGAAKLRIPGSSLSEGTYTYWFDRDGVKQDKMNTLQIEFEQMSPQVYIEAPIDRKPWPEGDIEVKGAVLPNWSVSVESAPLPIDRATRRFAAKVSHPSSGALAIRLSHPQRGIHYYTRRSK